MEYSKKINLDGHKKHPGQNHKNKWDCWVQSHNNVKKCREYLEKRNQEIWNRNRDLAENRTLYKAMQKAKKKLKEAGV